MKDRVPTYPGRVKLTPVSGQTDTYDMERADQPVQEGTPLNKANLLTDETAAKIWPKSDSRPSNPSVNDALAALVQPEHSCAGTYVGTGTFFGELIEDTTSKAVTTQKDIVVGDGVLVKIDSSGNIYSSADSGSTWVSRGQAGTGMSWNSMCYGNGVYVARDVNKAAWSEDLDTWHTVQLHDLTYGTPWIAFGNGRFVTCDSYGFFYSDDGKTFTRTLQLPDNVVRNRIVYGNGVFVICGTYNQSSSYAMYSLDGIVWNSATLPGTAYATKAICFARGEFVAAKTSTGYGNYSVYTYIYTSKTGADWTLAATLQYNRSSSYYNDWKWMCYDAETDMLVLGSLLGDGATCIYWSDVDNANWKASFSTTKYSVSAEGATVFNGKIVLAGMSVDNKNNTHSTNVSLNVVASVEIPCNVQAQFLYIVNIGTMSSTRSNAVYMLATRYDPGGDGVHVQFLENRIRIYDTSATWINMSSAEYAYYCSR